MKGIDAYTDAFRARFEEFVFGCDSLEDVDFWNTEEYGEMDVYYLNELLSVILRLIAADGVVSEKEVEYMNKNFGFYYTQEELEAVYENCREEIGGAFYDRLRNDIETIRSTNVKLVAEFKELVVLICDIIAASDREIAAEEQKEIETIREIAETA